RRSLRGRQISRLVSCVRPLFFGHDLCPDRLSLPVQPIPGGWSWDRTAARWRCTRPHHAPASWTRWRHTAYDRLRPASCTGASSSVRFSVHGRPCCAPIRCCAPIQGLDIIISYSLKIRKLFSSRSYGNGFLDGLLAESPLFLTIDLNDGHVHNKGEGCPTQGTEHPPGVNHGVAAAVRAWVEGSALMRGLSGSWVASASRRSRWCRVAISSFWAGSPIRLWASFGSERRSY